jgi:hypothetical protein
MRTLALVVVAVAGGIVPAGASAARTPTWFAGLHRMATSAQVAATRFSACATPTQASPNLGNVCARARAKTLAHEWSLVAVASQTAAKAGPCAHQLGALQQAGTIVLGLGRSFAAGTLVTPETTLSPRAAISTGAKNATANWGNVVRCLAKRGPVTG